MNKKYIIIFLVVLVGCGGFLYYNHIRKGKEAQNHMTKEYSRRISSAKKSPSAGLRHMGQALNRYKDDKGVYPPSLSALYPDYISVKAFIDDVKWHYIPKVGDFYLRKSVEGHGDKVLTASTRSDLQLAIGSDNMLASNEEPKSSQVKAVANTSTEKSIERVTVASTTMSTPVVKPVAPEQQAKPYQTGGTLPDLQETRESPKPELEPFPTHQLSKKRRFVKGLKGGFLVWKNEDGSLGFGNIQYPLSEELTIFDGAEWVEISRRRPKLATIEGPL